MMTRFEVWHEAEGVYVWDRDVQSALLWQCIVWSRGSQQFEIYKTKIARDLAVVCREQPLIEAAVTDYLLWYKSNGDDWFDNKRRLMISQHALEVSAPLEAKHREFLHSVSVPDLGRKRAVYGLRQPACRECGEPTSNEVDLECCGCTWVVCAKCGGCGCGDWVRRQHRCWNDGSPNDCQPEDYDKYSDSRDDDERVYSDDCPPEDYDKYSDSLDDDERVYSDD